MGYIIVMLLRSSTLSITLRTLNYGNTRVYSLLWVMLRIYIINRIATEDKVAKCSTFAEGASGR